MSFLPKGLWFDEQGQTITEYALILAVILVVIVATVSWIDITLFH